MDSHRSRGGEGRRSLCDLGHELVEEIVKNLNARSLAALSAACKVFRSFEPHGGSEKLRLVERVARRAVLSYNAGDTEAASRHRWVIPPARADCMDAQQLLLAYTKPISLIFGSWPQHSVCNVLACVLAV
jgi:hypothetical protein